MSSMSGQSAMDVAAIERDDHGSCGGINRRRLHGRMSGAIRFILLGALSLASIGVGLRGATASQSPSLSILGCAGGSRQRRGYAGGANGWRADRGHPVGRRR